MVETKATTIRLTEAGRINADAIIRAGAASDLSGAIHVALALVAHGFVKAKRRP